MTSLESVTAGETFRKKYTLFEDSSMSEDLDVTGSNVTFEIFTSDKIDAEHVLSGTAQLTDADDGVVTVSLSPAQTQDLAGRVLYYYVHLKYAGAAGEYDLDSGKLMINSRVLF